MHYIVIGLYVLAMTCMLAFCVLQLGLAMHYVIAKRKERKGGIEPYSMDSYPFVTIQLPVYNEQYVVERLIDAIAAFEYPRDRFEVQLLDDSTDESIEIAAKKVAEHSALGLNIQQVRRPERKGYKAGALQYGLVEAKGEFVAIFDADFVPAPDFLLRTIPAFKDQKIGMVQTKWEHLNQQYSLLTRIQAFALDLHFTVEQKGRNAAGYFINFNGTAGVWRRSCIDEAGGWHADTLTEDLDLSYRAQLKGWRFKYLEDVKSPAELPIEMNAMKSQQFRWNKGGAETAKKLIPTVMRSKLPFRTKVHACSHLFNSSIYILIFISAILSVPLLPIKNEMLTFDFYRYASVFLIATLSLTAAYAISIWYNDALKGKKTKHYFLFFPLFLATSLGLSLHNGLAVLRGYFGKQTPFVRTPKFNIGEQKGGFKTNKYVKGKMKLGTWLEGLLALYFVSGVLIGLNYRDFGLMPFHVLAAVGFSIIFFYSVKHTIAISK